MINPDAELEIRQTSGALWVLLLTTMVGLNFPQSRADDLPWHEQRYIEMLSQKNLDSLAKSHAIKRRDLATDDNEKAHWQLTLAKLSRNQVWFVDSQSRSQMLEQLLKESIPFSEITKPSLRFRLQMESSRIVLIDSTIALITAEASRLYSGSPHAEVKFVEARLSQLSQEIDRLELSFRQVSSRNSVFQNVQKYEIRSGLRLLIAQLKCQHFHWHAISNSSADTKLLNALNTELDDMLRATRSEATETQLQLLLADLASRYSAPSDYRLRRLTLLSKQSNLRPTEIAEIQIRFLLRQQQIEEAEKLLANPTSLTRLEKERLLWLAAEIAVGRAEQAMRLNDRQLISSAAQRLQTLRTEASHSKGGVLVDATRTCLKDAKRILDLGPQLARTLKSVDLHRQQERPDQALQLVNLALKRLPASHMETQVAALLLTAAELHIALNEWSQAKVRAAAAVEGFTQLKMIDQAAAAHLLKCFAQSRLISNQPDGRSQYLTALQEHCDVYPDSETAAIATAWLFKLTSNSNPDIAITAAIDRLRRSTDPAEQDRLHENIAEELWLILTSDNFQFEARLHAWRDSLVDRALDQTIELEDFSGRSQVEIAMALVNGNATTTRLNEWRHRLTWQERNHEGIQTELRFQLLSFTIDSKLSIEAHSIEASRKQLLDRSEDDLKQALWFLARVTNSTSEPGQVQPGDVVLVRTIDQIVLRLIKLSPHPAKIAMECLPIISRTASVTGDQLAMESIMEVVSPEKLTIDGLTDLAPTLAQLAEQPAITPQLKHVLTEFWRRVVKSQTAGSELWLEGLVQIGTLTAATSKNDSLLKQFQTANILYPEWGSPKRRAAAAKIMKQLQQ